MKIYIDGENFRKGLVDVLVNAHILSADQVLRSFDVVGLMRAVTGESKLEIVYYASRLKLPRGYTPSEQMLEYAERIREESRAWLGNLTNQGIKIIKAGNLKIKRAKPCFKCGFEQEILQEKGVDVRLAVDLMSDISRNSGAIVGIVSSDADLCPALQRIRESRVRVNYICFSSLINRALAAVSDETTTIPLNTVKRHIKGVTQ